MNNIYDDYITLGVSVFLPHLSFGAELSRMEVRELVTKIDSLFDKEGINENSRIETIMSESYSLSLEMVKENVNVELATTELAYNFAYVFTKKRGEVLENIRGIVCMIEDNILHIEGYKEQTDYKECVDLIHSMTNISQSNDDDDDEPEIDLTPVKPTIH